MRPNRGFRGLRSGTYPATDSCRAMRMSVSRNGTRYAGSRALQARRYALYYREISLRSLRWLCALSLKDCWISYNHLRICLPISAEPTRHGEIEIATLGMSDLGCPTGKEKHCVEGGQTNTKKARNATGRTDMESFIRSEFSVMILRR